MPVYACTTTESFRNRTHRARRAALPNARQQQSKPSQDTHTGIAVTDNDRQTIDTIAGEAHQIEAGR